MTKIRGQCCKILSLAALALFLCGCQSYFYYPTHITYYDPARLNMKYEDVHFKTVSGDDIHAWYFASIQRPSKGTILFFHGNAQNMSSHFLMFYWLLPEGYNYMVFDYPGYGESSGKPTPKSTVEAGIAAAAWLRDYKETRPLILYGQSLGGIIAMRTAVEVKDRQPIRNIVVEGSFSSYRKVARQMLARSWWTWALQPLTYMGLSDSWAPEPLSQLAPIPLLFVHGTNDPMIFPESSEAMYAAARDPKDLWLVPNGHHGDLFEVNNRELRQKFLNYLQ